MSVTRVVPLNVNASLLKVVGIFLTLAARHDIVCSTVADHVRHVVGVDVSVSAESGMLVGTLLRSASTDHVVLWRHWNRIATAFVSTVDRTRPVAHSVDATALACELSKLTLDVDRLASYFHNSLSVCHTHHGSQVTSRRESRDTDERVVDFKILLVST